MYVPTSSSQENSLHSTVSTFMPLHSLPPQDGVGLLQTLNFSLTPPPQFTEQSPTFQSDQPPSTTGKINLVYTYAWWCWSVTYVPGQQWTLQEIFVTLSPWQSLPPQLGLGLVHVRLLVIMPPPQVAEHSDSSVHSLHSPSTGTQQINTFHI